MKIVFLDAKSIGDDIDLSGFDQLGEVVKYGFSTPEEAGERTKDADVVIINKVQINEQTIGRADHLKLVPIIWTRNIWQRDRSNGAMSQDIPQRPLRSIHLRYCSICWKN